MYFPILIFYVSINCWKDSSGIPISPVVTASTSSKWVSLMIPQGKEESYSEQDRAIREVVPVRWFSSQPGAAGCSAQPILLLFRHAQIYGDNLPNTILFYVRLICDHLNSQLTITTHNLLYSLDVDLSPVWWRAPTPEIIFHLFPPFFEPLMQLKTHVCDMNFPQKKLPSIFVPQTS